VEKTVQEEAPEGTPRERKRVRRTHLRVRSTDSRYFFPSARVLLEYKKRV